MIVKEKEKVPGTVRVVGFRTVVWRALVRGRAGFWHIAGGAAAVLLGAGWLTAAELQADSAASPGLATIGAVALAVGAFAVVLGIVAAIYSAITYNQLSALRKELDLAMAEIDGLRRREFELMPELVRISGPSILYESSILRELTRLRNAWLVAWETADKWKLGDEMGAGLAQLFVAAEIYPALREDANFTRLRETAGAIETEIAAGREFYNAAALRFNARLAEFPARWIAPYAGFSRCALFESAAADGAGGAAAAGDAPKSWSQSAGGSR